MRVTLVVLIVLCTVMVAHSLPAFPNIEYLGMGYNLLLGNPSGSSLAQLSDPGWTVTPVIHLTYLENKTTGDNRYLLPDQASAVPTEAYLDTTTQSYQSSLEVDVSLSGGYNDVLSKAAFTASGGYQNAQRQSCTRKDVRRTGGQDRRVGEDHSKSKGARMDEDSR